MIRVLVFAIFLILATPGQVLAPEYTDPPKPKPVERPALEVIEVGMSRGASEPIWEKRVMRVTAYTNHDPGMDGLGITASGEKTQEGRTIAADRSIPFGTEIYIPALGQTYTVTDRGGAIRGDRLDLYIEDLDRALEFGVQDLEVFIREER